MSGWGEVEEGCGQGEGRREGGQGQGDWEGECEEGKNSAKPQHCVTAFLVERVGGGAVGWGWGEDRGRRGGREIGGMGREGTTPSPSTASRLSLKSGWVEWTGRGDGDGGGVGKGGRMGREEGGDSQTSTW